jgi:hypothetical protein
VEDAALSETVRRAAGVIFFFHGELQFERHFASVRTGGRGRKTSRRLAHDASGGAIATPRWLKLDNEQPDYQMSELRCCPAAAFTERAEAGNCNTVACWPSHIRVSSTISPSGNSSAS